MDSCSNGCGRLAFDHFEVDLRSGELLKNGRKIRLQPQPFQLLALLLERPGELVTREEVRNRLWPQDQFVDFDHSLGTAINKVREALCDSAENPRFIETLPRRGYRFIGTLRHDASEIPPKTLVPEVIIQGTRPGFHWERAAWILGLLTTAALIAYAWRSEHSQAANAAVKAVPVTAYTGVEVAPSFSPDGSRIAFAWSQDGDPMSTGFDLYVKEIGKESPVRLTSQPSRWISSAWSPDGKEIAFHRAIPSASGLYLVSAAGGSERLLHSTYAANSSDAAISWSPDGESIAYSDAPSAEGLHRLQIFSLATRESMQIPHVENCRDEYIPAFSHDGRRLAYICSLGWEQYGIAFMDLPQGKPRVLKTFRGWVRGLVFADDDKSLIFAHSQVGHENDGLRQLTLADSSVRALPYGVKGEWPALSRKGDLLVYDNYSSGGTSIWRTDLADPSAPPVKFSSASRDEMGPTYSPDGTRIAFTSSRSGSNEIWMCNANETDLVQLTSLGHPSGSPSWSPDGRRIAFDSRENGRAAIYVVDVIERVPRQISFRNVEEPSVPSWSHDGKWLYFIGRSETDDGRIFRAPADGGEATALSSSSGYAPFESFDGSFVYFVTFNGKKTILATASLKLTGTEARVAGVPTFSFAANWTIDRNGVYFYPADSPQTLTYFDFTSRKLRSVHEVGPGAYYGLSVSPDRRYALYAITEGATSDILMIKNPH